MRVCALPPISLIGLAIAAAPSPPSSPSWGHLGPPVPPWPPLRPLKESRNGRGGRQKSGSRNHSPQARSRSPHHHQRQQQQRQPNQNCRFPPPPRDDQKQQQQQQQHRRRRRHGESRPFPPPPLPPPPPPRLLPPPPLATTPNVQGGTRPWWGDGQQAASTGAATAELFRTVIARRSSEWQGVTTAPGNEMEARVARHTLRLLRFTGDLQTLLEYVDRLHASGRMLPAPDYASVLSAFGAQAGWEHALVLYRKMAADWRPPDETSLALIVDRLCRAGEWEQGLRVLYDSVDRHRTPMSRGPVVSLFRVMIEARQLGPLRRLVEWLEYTRPDLLSWHLFSAIFRLAHSTGNRLVALEIFENSIAEYPLTRDDVRMAVQLMKAVGHREEARRLSCFEASHSFSAHGKCDLIGPWDGVSSSQAALMDRAEERLLRSQRRLDAAAAYQRRLEAFHARQCSTAKGITSTRQPGGRPPRARPALDEEESRKTGAREGGEAAAYPQACPPSSAARDQDDREGISREAYQSRFGGGAGSGPVLSDSSSDSDDILGLMASPVQGEGGGGGGGGCSDSVASEDPADPASLEETARKLKRPRAQVESVLRAAFARVTDPDEASARFKELLRNVKSFGGGQIARKILDFMRSHGRAPDEQHYNLVLYYISKEGRWNSGLELLSSMRGSGYKPSPACCALLINATIEDCDWPVATRLLTEMRHLKVHPTRSVLKKAIASYEAGGQWELAIKIHRRMKLLGLR